MGKIEYAWLTFVHYATKRLKTRFFSARLCLPCSMWNFLRFRVDIQWWDHKELEVNMEILGVGFWLAIWPMGNNEN